MTQALEKLKIGKVGSTGREALEAYQLERLRELIKRARTNSTYYRDSLKDVAPLETVRDLEKLPFVFAEELRHQSGRLLAISTTAVKKAFSHFTTGTLGRPKRICFSQYDVDRIVEHMAVIMVSVMEQSGLKPEATKVGIYLPNYGRPLSMAEMLARAAALLGAESYIGNCEDIAEIQLEEIREHAPQLIMGSCFRMWRMTQVGRETLDIAADGSYVRDLGVRAMLVTSEYMSEDQRDMMERTWDAQVYHHYGMTEPGFAIGIECNCHEGFHYDETSMLFEVVNPETGAVLPDGVEGELVYTSLDREAMPFIRYRTGDVGTITHLACECGCTSARIGKLPKRIGLTYELQTGEELFASQLDDVLYGLDDLLDYRIFIEPNGEIVCRAERIGKHTDFSKRVEEKIREVPVLKRTFASGEFSSVRVEIEPRASLRRGGRTLKCKIVDERYSGFNVSENEIVLSESS